MLMYKKSSYIMLNLLLLFLSKSKCNAGNNNTRISVGHSISKALALHFQVIYKITHPISAGEHFPMAFYPDETCYKLVGCFSNRSPWIQPHRLVPPPQSPKIIGVNGYFFDRAHKGGLTFEVYPEIKLSNIPLDVTKPTFLAFHGWHREGFDAYMIKLKNGILKARDANVFMFDWLEGASANYIQAVGNTRLVGVLSALVINQTGIPGEKLHIIGHSLGAQIASYTSKKLSSLDKKPARMTALDPAFPFFEGYGPEVSLSSSDASFVDVYHTAALYKGYTFPIGHIDFYVNGGFYQPGCVAQTFAEKMKFHTCSHLFSLNLYTATLEMDHCLTGVPANPFNMMAALMNSISDGQYLSQPPNCFINNCIPLGLDSINSTYRGVAVVNTKSQPPICSMKNKGKL